jgi:hypothetical protein
MTDARSWVEQGEKGSLLTTMGKVTVNVTPLEKFFPRVNSISDMLKINNNECKA